MLKVSVNGTAAIKADHVILYDDDTPIAAATQHGDVVFYCDTVRDNADLQRVLRDLGIAFKPVAVSDNKIVGKVHT